MICTTTFGVGRGIWEGAASTGIDGTGAAVDFGWAAV